MCWYSKQRNGETPAAPGEPLNILPFPWSGTTINWPGSTKDGKARCLADGSMLKLSGIPLELQQALGIGSEAVAQFVAEQMNAAGDDLENFDVLVFPNGSVVSVSELPEGMSLDYLGTKAEIAAAAQAAAAQEPTEPVGVAAGRGPGKWVDHRGHPYS